MLNRCYRDIGPVSPQIWRSVSRLWFHVGFIWSFDPLISLYGRKGDNGGRSPKGERLCSAQSAANPSTQRQKTSPTNIILKKRGKILWKYPDTSIIHIAGWKQVPSQKNPQYYSFSAAQFSQQELLREKLLHHDPQKMKFILASTSPITQRRQRSSQPSPSRADTLWRRRSTGTQTCAPEMSTTWLKSPK